jgi:hypothetical protein
MKIELTIILFCFTTLFGCQTTTENINTNTDESLKLISYCDSLLQIEKYSLNFESDTDKGFLKIGNFLNEDRQNAILVSFDSSASFKIFELESNEWKLIFRQEDIDMTRAFSIEAFIEDYNFDGINDIGLRNEISNGTSIMTFYLWLNELDSFVEVPEFRNIGNPTIIKYLNRIQGYSACCAYSEMTLTNYVWFNNSLRKMEELEISNYPNGSGITANISERYGITQRAVKIKEKEINRIVDKFSSNWRIIDTTGKIGFTSGEVTFFY